jgi:hypothetical protein
MGGTQRRSTFPHPTWAVLIYVVVATSAGSCTSMLAFPGNATQLAGLAGAIGFLLAVVAALFYLTESWSLSRALAPIPLFVSILSAWLSFGAGRPIAKWWFNNVRLKQYEAAVAWVNSQPVPVAEPIDPEWSPPRIKLPPKYAPLAYVTEAHRHRDGSLIVVLAYSGAFPVKHFAYLYSSSGTWDHHLDQRWHGGRLAAKWFDVVD